MNNDLYKYSFTVSDLISQLESLPSDAVIIMHDDIGLKWVAGLEINHLGTDSSEYVNLLTQVNNCLHEDDKIKVGRTAVFFSNAK